MEEKEDEEDILEITELPVGEWTRNFKTDLEKLMQTEENGLLDMKEYHACDRIHFKLTINPKKLKHLQSKIKIDKSLACSNMVLFDNNQ